MRYVDLMKPLSALPSRAATILLKASGRMSACEGKELKDSLLTNKAKESKATLLETLECFPSLAKVMTVAELLAVLPPMKARYYSISSSPLAMPQRLSLTVGVVEGISPTGRLHTGVCSTHLQRLQVGQSVWVKVKDTSSSFRLPSNSVAPIIMVGAGTGLAPFRGFLQELQHRRRQNSKSAPEVRLFFGCRGPECCLYSNELQMLEADGTIAKGGLNIAYSRHGPYADRKYVQQDIEAEAANVVRMLQDGGHVYVCGDASKMAPAVKLAIEMAVRKVEIWGADMPGDGTVTMMI